MHGDPETVALQDCVSVLGEVALQVASPAQLGVMHARDRDPVRSQVPGDVWPHALHAPHVVAPQLEPVTVPLTHVWLSGVTPIVHAPLAHVAVVVVRVCVPLIAQAEPTMQLDHGVVTVAPQDNPSVVRVHSCVSSASVAAHAPLLHVDVVTVRDCEPACVHGSDPKSHGDQSLEVPGAHVAPSVDARVQARDSGLADGSQLPEWHVYVVTLRVSVPPVVAQTSVPKSQAPHAPVVAAGQSPSPAQPTQASLVASQ